MGLNGLDEEESTGQSGSLPNFANGLGAETGFFSSAVTPEVLRKGLVLADGAVPPLDDPNGLLALFRDPDVAAPPPTANLLAFSPEKSFLEEDMSAAGWVLAAEAEDGLAAGDGTVPELEPPKFESFEARRILFFSPL